MASVQVTDKSGEVVSIFHLPPRVMTSKGEIARLRIFAGIRDMCRPRGFRVQYFGDVFTSGRIYEIAR